MGVRLGADGRATDRQAKARAAAYASKHWKRARRPMVRFNGASRGRISTAALVCFKAGERSRLIYRPRIQDHHQGAHRGFTWQDYRDLLVRAHLQLGGPVVVIWDNLNVHRCSRLREYAAHHDWLTIVQLPSYAPDQPGRGHLVVTPAQHDRQRRLPRPRPPCPSRPQRPAPDPTTHRLIEGCLAETGLSLTTTTQRKGQ